MLENILNEECYLLSNQFHTSLGLGHRFIWFNDDVVSHASMRTVGGTGSHPTISLHDVGTCCPFYFDLTTKSPLWPCLSKTCTLLATYTHTHTHTF